MVMVMSVSLTLHPLPPLALQALQIKKQDEAGSEKHQKKNTFWHTNIAPFFNDTYYGSSDDEDDGDLEERLKAKKERKRAVAAEKALMAEKAAMRQEALLKAKQIEDEKNS